MHGTVDIAPAPAAPSPRHPLHVLVDPSDPDAVREAYPITGRRAAEIADEIGKELQQQVDDERAAEASRSWRKTHTKAGRTGAKRRGAQRGGALGSERQREDAALSEDAFLDNEYLPMPREGSGGDAGAADGSGASRDGKGEK